jgi:hypothetical protein
MNVIAMIHNTKLNRWHPVWFRDHPHSANTETVWRFKSSAHHTEGFVSRDAAMDSILIELIPALEGETRMFLDADYEWDGNDIPAIVQFFDVAALATVNAF